MTQEVLKSELDIFRSSFYQASIESSTLIQYRPVATIDDATTIEFVIPGSSEEYIDLQDIFMWLSASIVDENGKKYDPKQNGRYSIINYGLNTIFYQVDIYLSNTLVSQSSNTYPYRAYIESLTEYSELAKLSFLKSAGFQTPKSNTANFDEIDSDLANMVSNSRNFTLYGRLHGDILNSERLLINGVPLRIVLTRSK